MAQDAHELERHRLGQRVAAEDAQDVAGAADELWRNGPECDRP